MCHADIVNKASAYISSSFELLTDKIVLLNPRVLTFQRNGLDISSSCQNSKYTTTFIKLVLLESASYIHYVIYSS